jgi:hypothetical protein
MSAPTVSLAQDGVTWTATLSGVDGVADQAAQGDSAEEAAALVRDLAREACLAAAAERGLAVDTRTLCALELRLRHACSLALASLAPAPAPEAASGFGTDVSTIGDLDPYMPLISGPRIVAEAVARRLQTARGLLDHAPGQGFDTYALLNKGFSSAELDNFRAIISAEAEADERVLSASVRVSFNAPILTLTISVDLTTAEGPFALVLEVSKLGTNVSLLG